MQGVIEISSNEQKILDEEGLDIYDYNGDATSSPVDNAESESKSVDYTHTSDMNSTLKETESNNDEFAPRSKRGIKMWQAMAIEGPKEREPTKNIITSKPHTPPIKQNTYSEIDNSDYADRLTRGITIPFGSSVDKPLHTSSGKDGYLKEYWVNEWIGDIRRQVYKLIHKQTWHTQFTRPNDRRVITRTFNARTFGENEARAMAYNLMPWETGDTELRRPLGRPCKRQTFNPNDFTHTKAHSNSNLKIEGSDIVHNTHNKSLSKLNSEIGQNTHKHRKIDHNTHTSLPQTSTHETFINKQENNFINNNNLEEMIGHLILPESNQNYYVDNKGLELFSAQPSEFTTSTHPPSTRPSTNSSSCDLDSHTHTTHTHTSHTHTHLQQYSIAQLFCKFCNKAESMDALGKKAYSKLFSIIFPSPYISDIKDVCNISTSQLLTHHCPLEEYLLTNRVLTRLAEDEQEYLQKKAYQNLHTHTKVTPTTHTNTLQTNTTHTHTTHTHTLPLDHHGLLNTHTDSVINTHTHDSNHNYPHTHDRHYNYPHTHDGNNIPHTHDSNNIPHTHEHNHHTHTHEHNHHTHTHEHNHHTHTHEHNHHTHTHEHNHHTHEQNHTHKHTPTHTQETKHLYALDSEIDTPPSKLVDLPNNSLLLSIPHQPSTHTHTTHNNTHNHTTIHTNNTIEFNNDTQYYENPLKTEHTHTNNHTEYNNTHKHDYTHTNNIHTHNPTHPNNDTHSNPGVYDTTHTPQNDTHYTHTVYNHKKSDDTHLSTNEHTPETHTQHTSFEIHPNTTHTSNINNSHISDNNQTSTHTLDNNHEYHNTPDNPTHQNHTHTSNITHTHNTHTHTNENSFTNGDVINTSNSPTHLHTLEKDTHEAIGHMDDPHTHNDEYGPLKLTDKLRVLAWLLRC